MALGLLLIRNYNIEVCSLMETTRKRIVGSRLSKLAVLSLAGCAIGAQSYTALAEQDVTAPTQPNGSIASRNIIASAVKDDLVLSSTVKDDGSIAFAQGSGKESIGYFKNLLSTQASSQLGSQHELSQGASKRIDDSCEKALAGTGDEKSARVIGLFASLSKNTDSNVLEQSTADGDAFAKATVNGRVYSEMTRNGSSMLVNYDLNSPLKRAVADTVKADVVKATAGSDVDVVCVAKSDAELVISGDAARANDLKESLSASIGSTAGGPVKSATGKSVAYGDKLMYSFDVNTKDVYEQSLANGDIAKDAVKLGAVLRFDKALDIDENSVSVVNSAGDKVDATVQVKGQTVYVFIKPEDTYTKALSSETGEVKGRVPSDLVHFSADKPNWRMYGFVDSAKQGIDKLFTVTVNATVGKDARNTVSVTGSRYIDGKIAMSNTVSNAVIDESLSNAAVKSVDPTADEIEGTIKRNDTYLQRMGSTIIPPDAADYDINEWSITDTFDSRYDKFTGQWAVFMTDEAGVYKRVAGTNFDLGDNEPLFALDHEPGSNTVKVYATDWARQGVIGKLIDTADPKPIRWTAYLQFERIGSGSGIKNTFTEKLHNRPDITSNTVVTNTPVVKPVIDITVFDDASGDKDGVRNSAEKSLAVDSNSSDVAITYRITNSGNTSLGRLGIEDSVKLGSASLRQLVLPEEWDELVLKPGEHVDVKGGVNGINEPHKNVATATADPLTACKAVTYADPFKFTGSDGDTDVNQDAATAATECFNTDDSVSDQQAWFATGQRAVLQPDDDTVNVVNDGSQGKLKQDSTGDIRAVTPPKSGV